MSEVGNPTPPEYKGVSVEHPRVREYLKNCAKQGFSKEHAMKIVGVPMEVVDRVYKEHNDSKQ